MTIGFGRWLKERGLNFPKAKARSSHPDRNTDLATTLFWHEKWMHPNRS